MWCRTPQAIVYVIVGKEKQRFGIHKDLVCFHSPYFKGAFEGHFAEAKSGEVVLEDVRPEVFGIFVHWLYTKSIDETICIDTPFDVIEKFKKEAESNGNLFEAWLLAEYLQVPKLQNQIIRLLIEKSHKSGGVCKLSQLDALIYEKTSVESPLRKFCVDCMCWSSALDILDQMIIRQCPQEMIFDLCIAERKRRMNPSMGNPLQDAENYYVNEMLTEQKR